MAFSIFFYALLREINKEERRRSRGKSEKLWPENMAPRKVILPGNLVVQLLIVGGKPIFIEAALS